jgi:hypothetical protein
MENRFFRSGLAAAALIAAAVSVSASPPPFAVTFGSARIEWLKVFASDNVDWINEIVPLEDGNFVAVGFLNRVDGSPSSDWRALAVNLRPDGAIEWSREYGAGGGIDAFWSMSELADGKLMFGGFSSRVGPAGINAYFALTDADGTLRKENAYGTPGYDRITSLAPTAEGFIGVGHAEGLDGRDLLYIHTDKEGVETWRRVLAEKGANGALYIEPAGDGNFIVAGGTDGEGDADILVIKIDARGREIWRRTIGARGTDDINHGLVVLPSGRIVVPGYTASWGARERDFMAATLDRDGNIQRLETYGGPGDDHVILAKPDATGRVWMIGYSKSAGAGGWEIMIAALDARGSFQDGVLLLGGSRDDNGAAIRPLADGDLLIGGYSDTLGNGPADAFVARLSAPALAPHPLFKTTTVK